MYLPQDAREIKFNTYYSFGRYLDYIWHTCAGRNARVAEAQKYAALLVKWRSTINKMRIYNSAGVSLIEQLNYNRAVKDIDSLLFRLSKIVGVMPVQVDDDTEPESAERSNDS